VRRSCWLPLVTLVAASCAPLSSTPSASPLVSPSASSSLSVSPSPTQAVPTAAEGASAAPAGPSIAWTSVALAPFGSNRVWAVAAAKVGSTIVVAANDATQNDMKPVLIESPNGSNWTRVPTDGAEFANSRLDYLVPVPGGLLLVGESLTVDPSCAAAAAGCNQAPSAVLMWRSSDGMVWQPLGARQINSFDRVWISSMAAGPAGLEASGLYDPPTAKPGTPEAVVLHSIDGVNWSSRAFPDQNGGSTGVLNQGIIATANGFVAVGSGDMATGAVGSAGAGAWYSPDGLAWTRAITPSTTSASGLRYAAAGARGMVATSYDPEGSNAWWVSVDGKTWQTPDTSPFTVGASWLAGDLHNILVISGPSVYWSEDGRLWRRGDSAPAMPSTGIVGATDLAWVFGSTVIVVSPDDLSLYVGQVLE